MAGQEEKAQENVYVLGRNNDEGVCAFEDSGFFLDFIVGGALSGVEGVLRPTPSLCERGTFVSA